MADETNQDLFAVFAETKEHSKPLVLTHVPPFRESCWHNGSVSEETWLPGFTCKAVGDLLTSVAESHAKINFTVLCGHTHGSGYVRMSPNLDVHTGFGDYGILRYGIVDPVGKKIKVNHLTSRCCRRRPAAGS